MNDKKNLFSIGEVAKAKGLTVKALRYYHKIGILSPQYIDEKTGYRYYTITQFIHIEIIKEARRLGTSIKELQKLFEKADTSYLMHFLEAKKKAAKKAIRELNASINHMDALANIISSSRQAMMSSDLKLETLPLRQIITVPCKATNKWDELLDYSTLDKFMQAHGITQGFESGSIYKFSNTGSFLPVAVFKVVDRKYFQKRSPHFTSLPAGYYLTLSYEEENEALQRNRFIDFIKQNQVPADRILEVDLFHSVFNTNTYSCQIQTFLGNKMPLIKHLLPAE